MRLAPLLLVPVVASSLLAQGKDVAASGLKKNDQVVIAIPFNLALKHQRGFSVGAVRDFQVRRGASGQIEVLDSMGVGDPNWRQAGFPSLIPMRVVNVKTVKMPDQSERVEVTVEAADPARKPSLGSIWIYAPKDQQEILAQVLPPESASDSVRDANYAAIEKSFFAGPLAVFGADERTSILRWANMTAQSTKIQFETYKSVGYLVVWMPGDGSTWNNLVINQAKRLAKVLTDQFPMLKTFAKMSAAKEPIGGLKLWTTSCHGTAPDYGDIKCDQIEVYFPLADLLKFRDADITSQQLINQSVVLVGGDRVEVSLASQ